MKSFCWFFYLNSQEFAQEGEKRSFNSLILTLKKLENLVIAYKRFFKEKISFEAIFQDK